MTRIVVMGAGIGGLPTALEVKKAFGAAGDVTVVSDADTFHFVPSNPWVAVGWRKREQIEVPLAPVLKKRKIGFVHSAAEKVLPDENRIRLANGDHLDYDYLVVATGPELAFDEIEGLGPQGHTQSICHVGHADTAFTNWEEFCRNPGHIVVGAVQGASCFGPAYEFALIMDAELRKRKIRHKVPMTFVTSEPYIGHLGLGGVGDTKGILETELRNSHIRWLTNSKIDKITADAVHVTQVDEAGKDLKSHVLESSYKMFIPAFRGIPAVFGIEGLTNPRGFIVVDSHQRNPKYPNIFGVGVCIAIPPVEVTPVPTGCPKTGYMIETMVTATAQNMLQLSRGQAPTHEPSWSAVCLADFGDGGVAFVAQPQIPPRNVNWSSEGKWVRTAKVAFEKYFLRKMRKGISETTYEKYFLKSLGITRLNQQ